MNKLGLLNNYVHPCTANLFQAFENGSRHMCVFARTMHIFNIKTVSSQHPTFLGITGGITQRSHPMELHEHDY